jgi:hypothetical protein
LAARFGLEGVGGEFAQRVCCRSLALVAAVQTEQRGAGRGVARPVHQLPEPGARVGGEHAAGMAQIMKVDHRQARSTQAGLPNARAEVAATQRPSSGW